MLLRTRGEKLLSYTARLRLERDLDLGVTARNRGRSCRRDSLAVLSNARPLGAARENDEGDTARAQVLLVPDAPVGREQNIEAGLFCGLQERPVAESIPALGLSGVDGVPGQRADQPFGRAVVKEDEHRLQPDQRGDSAPRSRVRR